MNCLFSQVFMVTCRCCWFRHKRAYWLYLSTHTYIHTSQPYAHINSLKWIFEDREWKQVRLRDFRLRRVRLWGDLIVMAVVAGRNEIIHNYKYGSHKKVVGVIMVTVSEWLIFESVDNAQRNDIANNKNCDITNLACIKACVNEYIYVHVCVSIYYASVVNLGYTFRYQPPIWVIDKSPKYIYFNFFLITEALTHISYYHFRTTMLMYVCLLTPVSAHFRITVQYLSWGWDNKREFPTELPLKHWKKAQHTLMCGQMM